MKNLLLASLALLLSCAPAFADNALNTASQSNFKLVLPLNAAGLLSGKADAVELQSSAWTVLKVPFSNYFYIDQYGYHFTAPGEDGNSATTDNSGFGRAEMIDQRRFGPTTFYDSGEEKLMVALLPSKGTVVFKQIHRNSSKGTSMSPLVKMVATDQGPGKGLLIRGLVEATNGAANTQFTFKAAPQRGTNFTARLLYVPVAAAGQTGVLIMIVNGEPQVIGVDMTGSDQTDGHLGSYNDSVTGTATVVVAP